MSFSLQEINQLSRLSSRGVFGKALLDMDEKYPNLRVVVADVMTSARLEDFALKVPHKLINVGIAEQNMIGISAGLASEGMTVYASSFAPFASMRCFEMLRTQLGYMNLNVKVVGILSGLAVGVLGNTHYGLEDLAITRTIPNMTVLSPADGLETYKAVQAAATIDGPVYLRLTGVKGFPVVYKEDFDYQIGKGIVLREGTDIAIIATGSMVSESFRASRSLARDGISAAVIDMHTIKPLDKELLDIVFSKYKYIVTVEEHFMIGGLGGAVSEYKAGFENTPPQLILGIPDSFEKAGDYSYMLDKVGLTASKIAQTVKENYQKLIKS